jgi:hypothetical protein
MRIEKMFLMLAAIGLVASVFIQQAHASMEQKRSRAQSPSARSNKTNMKTDSKEEPIFACRLDALDAAQRERHKILWAQFRDKTREVKELTDGYGFRFPADSSTILAVAEWTTLERLCCPFFNFALEIEGESDSAWLRVTGQKGVKEFLRLEMNIQ